MLVRRIRVACTLGVLALLASTSLGDTPVADAARSGNVDAVQTLLRDGADVNSAHGDGMSALHWAASQNRSDIAEILLYAGAHPNATTRLGGYTPLHLAARQGYNEVISALVSGGSSVEDTTSLGITALHFAAQSGETKALKALRDGGANLDVRQQSTQQTPLMWAAAKGRTAAVTMLLAEGADPALTTTVVDYVERASYDREARRLRRQLMEAQLAASGFAPEVEEEPNISETAADQLNNQEAQPEAHEDEGPEAEDGAHPESPLEESVEPENQDEGKSVEESEVSEEPSASQGDEPGEEGAAAEAAEEEENKDESGDEDPEEDKELAVPAARPMGFVDLVSKQGGITALHFAAREGHRDVVAALLSAGASVDQITDGDHSTPLLMAVINGNYDLASDLIEAGADPNLTSHAGAAPLFTTLNNRWAPKALYPQPTAFKQQELSYLDLMELLLDAGAEVNAQLKHSLWYTSYNFDLLGVKFQGATPFWRAAYATDVPAMRLLLAYGADDKLWTTKAPQRLRRRGGEDQEDQSGLDSVPVGGPAVSPLHAASGVGYGQGFAGNAHRHVSNGWMPAIRFLVEERGHDVNARDHNGLSAVHHAAARGDNEVILYLVKQGADVTFVSRRGLTTVDIANGPQQRIQPFPETIALLEELGAINNHNCKSC